ncbi:MAG TPA: SDR family NAD(P)-dependent oxidoreductase, partial [Thermoanaerobaculia bacterium]
MRMKDKVAIVTGAAAGIGKEIARAFAREGARVGIADLTLEQSEQAAREIGREGGHALPVAMDVSD